MEHKSALDKLREKIKDKKLVLYSLVGGEVLHGDQLKQFISKLRERSVVYKQYRSRLQSLSEECVVLGRSADSILLLEPTIPNAEQMTKNNEQQLEASEDLEELKLTASRLAQSVDYHKAKLEKTRGQLEKMRAMVQMLEEKCEDMLKVRFDLVNKKKPSNLCVFFFSQIFLYLADFSKTFITEHALFYLFFL